MPPPSSLPGQPWERGADLSNNRWEASSSASEPRPPWETREPREPLPNPYARPISATPPEPERPRSPWSHAGPVETDDEDEPDAPAAEDDEAAEFDDADDVSDEDTEADDLEDADEDEVPAPTFEAEDENDESDDEPAPHRAGGVVIGIGIGLGVLLAAGGVAGLTAREGLFGLASLAVAAVVVAILTAVAVRRGIGGDWRIAGVLGVVAGLAVAGRDFGPSWLPSVLIVYAATVGGIAAMLLTRPVRKLTSLVFEYGIAILCSLAGAGAVAGILGTADVGRTTRSATIVAAITVALVLAIGIRTRLTERETTGGEFVFIGLFVAAVVVAAAATGVITASETPSMLSRTLDGVWGGVLLIALPFALLGVGAMVRVWTPAGWWVSAPAAIGTSMVAAVIGTDGSVVVGPVLLGALGGCVAGFLLTVLTALVVGMRMRSPSQRGRRQIWRNQDEPARLAAL
ncbi:hypothetical protein [Tenggerimyces flavus]|uniref:DUF4203 domain-containing protein n=1 Tax=Tenggerimyces flavus TaxID=1708749 RepID=A0ABV7YFT5_9ACTN|nr:hypothetical protein [Tenggerimyces flavus]MBM7784577.1 hypothetical protein [Tenggerimyces flavus]